MSEQIGDYPANASSPITRIARLAKRFASRKFRKGYVAQHVTTFLAMQIRALRGSMSQAEFGKKIGKPQSVVSRLENQGTVANIHTLIDIADRLDIGLYVGFTDYPTFLKWTDDLSPSTLAPAAYSQEAVDKLAAHEDQRQRESALAAYFRLPEPPIENAERKLGSDDIPTFKPRPKAPGPDEPAKALAADAAKLAAERANRQDAA